MWEGIGVELDAELRGILNESMVEAVSAKDISGSEIGVEEMQNPPVGWYVEKDQAFGLEEAEGVGNTLIDDMDLAQ